MCVDRRFASTPRVLAVAWWWWATTTSTRLFDSTRRRRRRNGSGTGRRDGPGPQRSAAQRLALQHTRTRIDHANLAKEDNEAQKCRQRMHMALLAAASAPPALSPPAAARSAASPHLNVRTAPHCARKRLQCALLALRCLPHLRCAVRCSPHAAAAPRSAPSATALSQRPHRKRLQASNS